MKKPERITFPRFPLAIGALSFFGLGVMEIIFSTPTFPWLPRLYDMEMNRKRSLRGCRNLTCGESRARSS